MLQMLIFGIMLAGGRVFNTAFPITTASCISGLWLGHMAYIFVFGALFLKTWRVYNLMCLSLKRVKITNNDMVKMMGGLVSAGVVYLVLLTVIGRPEASYLTFADANQETHYPKCKFEYVEFHTALFAIEAVVLAYGLKLCYAVKDLPDAVNESQYIAFGKCVYLE